MKLSPLFLAFLISLVSLVIFSYAAIRLINQVEDRVNAKLNVPGVTKLSLNHNYYQITATLEDPDFNAPGIPGASIEVPPIRWTVTRNGEPWEMKPVALGDPDDVINSSRRLQRAHVAGAGEFVIMADLESEVDLSALDFRVHRCRYDPTRPGKEQNPFLVQASDAEPYVLAYLGMAALSLLTAIVVGILALMKRFKAPAAPEASDS